MKIVLSLLFIAFASVSCTNMPPRLDNSKPLEYSFKQPARKALADKQSAQLGQPKMDSIHKNTVTYYSANGNLCRRLSGNRAVCHIGGKWYAAASVIATGK